MEMIKALKTLPPKEKGKLYFTFRANYGYKFMEGDMEWMFTLPLTTEQVRTISFLVEAVRQSGEYEMPLIGGRAGDFAWVDWGLDDIDKGEWEKVQEGQ